MSELLAVMLITVLSVISPGGDFAMVTRNSYLYGRATGIWTAVGIACGVWVHVAYTLLGVSILLTETPWLLGVIKILGAAYLIYIGWQTFNHLAIPYEETSTKMQMASFSAWKTGFFANALNPKTTLFILSVFTQVINAHTPITYQASYGAFISLAHLIWFACVAAVLSAPKLRNKMLSKQLVINRIIGGILMLLGLLLAFASI